MNDTQEKEHLTYWRGFHLAMDVVFNTLKNYEFDFSGCTNSDQICNEVKEAIESEVEYLRRGD